MAIDLEAILYATDIVNEKFSIWDIPNNVDVEFKKAIKRLKGTYYWLPVDRMLQKAELLEVNGDPGPLLFYGEYVTIINENKAFNIESAEAATMYHITSKGVAFFNFLLCESVINRMFYHPTKFTFK